MITIALLIAAIGLALYLPSLTPKANEIGRIMFGVGLLAWLLGGIGSRVLL